MLLPIHLCLTLVSFPVYSIVASIVNFPARSFYGGICSIPSPLEGEGVEVKTNEVLIFTKDQSEFTRECRKNHIGQATQGPILLQRSLGEGREGEASEIPDN
jgi:hypothetical protein